MRPYEAAIEEPSLPPVDPMSANSVPNRGISNNRAAATAAGQSNLAAECFGSTSGIAVAGALIAAELYSGRKSGTDR